MRLPELLHYDSSHESWGLLISDTRPESRANPLTLVPCVDGGMLISESPQYSVATSVCYGAIYRLILLLLSVLVIVVFCQYTPETCLSHISSRRRKHGLTLVAGAYYITVYNPNSMGGLTSHIY